MPFEDILYLFRSDVTNRRYVRLNFLEAGLLFKTALIAPGNILEIGTKIGGSAVLLACAVEKDNARKVYSIDIIPHTKRGRGEKLNTMTQKSLLRKIDFIVGESTRVASGWPEKLGMIFIDGEHTPDALSKDIDAWSPHLLVGGYMAFHDIGVAGTKKGMRDAKRLAKVIRRKLSSWKTVEHVQSLLVLQKVKS